VGRKDPALTTSPAQSRAEPVPDAVRPAQWPVPGATRPQYRQNGRHPARDPPGRDGHSPARPLARGGWRLRAGFPIARDKLAVNATPTTADGCVVLPDSAVPALKWMVFRAESGAIRH